jgi:hypothetical protein
MKWFSRFQSPQVTEKNSKIRKIFIFGFQFLAKIFKKYD